MNEKVLIEVCVDTVESAIAAQTGGADRVELCDNLMEGGTTPSFGAIEQARKNLEIGLHVIIRPRGGDFLYSDLEYEIIKRDIEICKKIGADGVVIGILTADGEIDAERTKQLVDLARPLSVTFHRAFDVTKDARKSLETLISLGIDRVLTSGQEPTAFEGIEMLAELVGQAGDRITILGCGSLNPRNAKRFVEKTGVKEIHLTGFTKIESEMVYRNERVYMGGALRSPEFTRSVASSQIIASVCKELS